MKPLKHALLAAFLIGGCLYAEKKPTPKFSWNNPPGKWTLKDLPKNLQHASFVSLSMKIKVGYYIYLPDDYDQNTKRYPVVYHLHGGRPGSEKKSISLSNDIDHAMKNRSIQPTIYVFPNGGPMSWYIYPQMKNGMAENILIQELIPHIDQTYRTIPTRKKRALQGFSQGGRGTLSLIHI